MAAGRTQSLNGAPFLKAPGFRVGRHVIPGVVGRLFPTEAAVVFADDDLILANDDAAA
jgi:hypothetical protein